MAVFLWALSLVLLARVVLLGRGDSDAARPARGRIVWTVLLAGALLLLFRPHEDIYGGQDPGSYVNSAASYARHGSLTYVDPLLEHVPPAARSLFFYGHAGFRQTKGACLWIKDLDRATVGPWFQPAYPLLMSIPAGLGSPWAALYVAPFFALCTGLAVAALATRLLPGRWTGALAFAFYVLNPNTAWHARCARPGLVAGFLLLGGWTLLLAAMKRTSRRWPADLVLGSLALATAPFFHITACFVLIPLAAWSAVIALRGRPAGLVAAAAIAGSLAATVRQAVDITDCYGIARALEGLPGSPYIVSTALLAVCLVLAAAAWVLLRRRPGAATAPLQPPPGDRRSLSLPAGLLAATSGIVLLAIQAGWLPAGTSLCPGVPVLSRLRLTDVPRVVMVFSAPLAVLGGIGWLVFLVRQGPTQGSRLLTAALFLPAALLVGRMPHLMYFSRRAQPVLVPLLVLGLTAIPWIVPSRAGWRRVLRPLVVLVILGCALPGRTHLYTLTEHRGFVRSLERIADEIRAHDGILLCEYSRIAAPFDHFFGIPVLGIDRRRKADRYDDIADAWEEVMRSFPDRPAYFLTPFDTTWGQRFELVRVGQYGVRCRKLRTSPALPTDIVDYDLTLTLSRFAPPPRPPGPALYP